MKRFGRTVLWLGLLWILTAAPALAGSVVQARCDCGYHSGQLLIFGGKSNFQSVCWFPAYCPGVKEVLLINMYQTPLASPGCTEAQPLPYDHPSLVGKPGRHPIAGWSTKDRIGRNLVLTNGTYLCPVCGQKTLRFFPTGMWD